LGLCRHARDERRRQRNTQCGQQPPGWAPSTPRGGQPQRRKPAPHAMDRRPDPHSCRSFRPGRTGQRTTPLSHHGDAATCRGFAGTATVFTRRYPLGVPPNSDFPLAICLDFWKMRYIVKVVLGERMGRTG
jgi:hypothetical protein